MWVGKKTRIFFRQSVLFAVMLIVSISAGAQTTDSTRVRLRYYPDMYHERGRSSADADYSATAPFVTGFITGMIVPFTTGYLAYLSDRKAGSGGGLAGFAGFVLTLWGGKKVANVFSTPAPENSRQDFSRDQRISYEEGYEKRINDKRSIKYASGVFVGFLADMALFFWLASMFGGAGS